MKQDEFEREFARIISRLGAFHQRAAGPPEGAELFPEVVEELGSALEELRVSGEQLRVQADEAASSLRLLEDERRRYRELFELAPFPYLITDRVGVVREANRRACAALGVQRRFLIGRPMITYLPGDDRLAFRDLLRRLDEGEPHGDVQLRFTPRGGSAPLLATTAVSAVRDAGGRTTRICWAVRSMRVSLGTVSQAPNEPSETLHWLSIQAAGAEGAGGSVTSILQHALDDFSRAAVPLFGATGAGIMLLDASGELRWLQTLRRFGRAFEQAQVKYHEGPCIDAFEENAVVWTDDLAEDDRWPRMRLLTRDQVNVRAVLSAPIETGSGPVGTCNILSAEPKAWNESHVGAIRAYAHALGTLLRIVAEAHASSVLASQLQYALDQRVVIEQAKGVLMEREGMGSLQAFERLRATARSTQRKLADVAAEVVEDAG
jgi:PAS domain S-box-containing protein